MDRKLVFVKGNLLVNIIAALASILFITGTANAQTFGSPPLRVNGFYTMPSVEMAIWNIPDLNIESEAGMGLGARFGYIFESSYEFSLGFDISRISPGADVTYDFVHIDLGIGYIWPNQFNRLRPFVRPSFVILFGHSIEVTDDIFSNPELNNLRGIGIGGGLGSYYFVSTQFSLQLSYNYSLIKINNLRLGLNSLEPEDNAQTHRLLFGAIIHF